MAKFLVVTHPKTGESYGMTERDYRNAKVGPNGETREEQGFKIVGYENGDPYEPKKVPRDADVPRPAEEARAKQTGEARDVTADPLPSEVKDEARKR